MHLLIVEDERALCDTVARSLRRSAYSVDCCYDGEKALELLETSQVDLLILDIMMPGMDGYQLTERIRVRSGAAGSEPAEKGRNDGAAHPAADRQRDTCADPLGSRRGGG